MKGGIGRCTFNLVKALRNLGLNVYVACNEAGKGDFSGLSPTNKRRTGLGLIISKSIIEAHGGKIWAENNKEGRGATFSISLPIVKK
jgi:hypothetical protein